jgi:molecular chaperone DnaK (HSP70)
MDSVPQQARLVVLDLGGGTVDVTVVDRNGDALSVVGQPLDETEWAARTTAGGWLTG